MKVDFDCRDYTAWAKDTRGNKFGIISPKHMCAHITSAVFPTCLASMVIVAIK